MQAIGLYIVIPAHNEGPNIEKVLQDLVRIRASNPAMIKRIIVVNDGSTDNTGKIAERYADQVIQLEKNMGKARAFWEGLKFCWKEKAEIMITLDADLKSVSEAQLKGLVDPLGVIRDTKMEIKTVIGLRKDRLHAALCGERAFLVKSFKALMIRKDLQKILLADRKTLLKYLFPMIIRAKIPVKKAIQLILGGRLGHGLELFLQGYFRTGDTMLAHKTDFEVGPYIFNGKPGVTPKAAKRLSEETGLMYIILSEKSIKAHKLIEQRKKGKISLARRVRRFKKKMPWHK